MSLPTLKRQFFNMHRAQDVPIVTDGTQHDRCTCYFLHKCPHTYMYQYPSGYNTPLQYDQNHRHVTGRSVGCFTATPCDSLSLAAPILTIFRQPAYTTVPQAPTIKYRQYPIYAKVKEYWGQHACHRSTIDRPSLAHTRGQPLR